MACSHLYNAGRSCLKNAAAFPYAASVYRNRNQPRTDEGVASGDVSHGYGTESKVTVTRGILNWAVSN